VNTFPVDPYLADDEPDGSVINPDYDGQELPPQVPDPNVND
jgi:hypothetical protein